MKDPKALAELKQQLLQNHEEWHDSGGQSGQRLTIAALGPLLDAHREWLDSKRAKGMCLEFCAADLRGADLHGAELSRANFTMADLRGVELHGALLISARLRGADLRDAILRECDLRGANLRCADLDGAELSKADLRGANLRATSMVGAFLHNADLSSARLDVSDLQDADLSGAILSMSELRVADLCDADLTNTHFGLANLSQADLSGANVRGARLEDAIGLPGRPSFEIDGESKLRRLIDDLNQRLREHETGKGQSAELDKHYKETIEKRLQMLHDTLDEIQDVSAHKKPGGKAEFNAEALEQALQALDDDRGADLEAAVVGPGARLFSIGGLVFYALALLLAVPLLVSASGGEGVVSAATLAAMVVAPCIAFLSGTACLYNAYRLNRQALQQHGYRQQRRQAVDLLQVAAGLGDAGRLPGMLGETFQTVCRYLLDVRAPVGRGGDRRSYRDRRGTGARARAGGNGPGEEGARGGHDPALQRILGNPGDRRD